MANAGPNDNGSQFFFTLGPTPELMNKHTIFAKVRQSSSVNPRSNFGLIPAPIIRVRIYFCEDVL